MEKILKYLWLFVIATCLNACNDEEALTPSGEELFPPKEQTELDKQLAKMYSDYNTVIEYRYIKNLLPKDWYYITPVSIDYVLPMAQFLKDMWIAPLEAGSSKEFVQAHFPKMIVLVGSPAYQKDGSVVLGQAEGGTLIRFTEVNYYSETSRNWKQGQLETAFHEYAHLLHQTFNLPDAFRQVTPDSYTKNGWMAVTSSEALKRGMVSPYATSAFAEDFAEIFSFYLSATDEELDYYFNQQPVNSAQDVDLNKGRALLMTKLNILVKFLDGIGMDIDKIREDLQNKLDNLDN